MGEYGRGSAQSTEAWLPSVALVSDPRSPTARVAQSDGSDVDRAVRALQAVSIYDGPVDLENGLLEAATALTRLGACLPSRADVPPARSALQEYFRIRLAPMERAIALSEAVSVCRTCVDDLRFTPLAGSDLDRELTAMGQVLCDLRTTSSGPSSGSVDYDALDLGSLPVQQRWMRRWILAHQLHALFNAHATTSIASALEHIETGHLLMASESLRRAATYVHGSGSARAHAMSIPAAFYHDVVRPTMTPPHCLVPLSGRMHLEYRMYRAQLPRLLRALPEGYGELEAQNPELARAREALYDADLIESEHHICLIEPLVGASRSLIQAPTSRENAVSSLRAIRNRRATTYRPFVRFGDRPPAAIDGIV